MRAEERKWKRRLNGSGVEATTPTVRHRLVALVSMHVSLHDEVDAVLDKDRLERLLAFEADGGRDVCAGDIPRAVTHGDDPGGLLPVDCCEVLLEPTDIDSARINKL
jgi:hypothetical protein